MQETGDMGLIPALERSLEVEMATHSSILPEQSHWQRMGHSPRGHKYLDMTEHTHGCYIFSFLRKLHTVVHSGSIDLHYHWQCTRALFSCQHLLILIFLMIASLIGRRRQWHPTPVLFPGRSHRRRSLEGCSPWGCWGSDTTEWLHFHFSLSCTGEGNGNPLQCSCLENPRDGGAWWAAVCGVAQSQIQLKWLSSSSSSSSSLIGMKWYFMVLICISLIISDIEHVLMYLLTICMHFWKNVYSYLVHLKYFNSIAFFCYWILQVLCIFIKCIICKYFLSLNRLPVLWLIYFTVQKVSSLM